jgi:hypothetical protein
MPYYGHGNRKGYIYAFEVIRDGQKFIKLGSSEYLDERLRNMENYEFGGKFKLIAKKKTKYWRRKENILHRRCGFGMIPITKKNGKPSNECYEYDMLEFIKARILALT